MAVPTGLLDEIVRLAFDSISSTKLRSVITVLGVVGPRPSPGGFNVGVDDFVVIPHTADQKQFGIRAYNMGRGEMRIVGLRYFNVYGPRESHKGSTASMILQLARQLLAGERPPAGPDFTTKYCNPLAVVTTRLAAAILARKSGPGAVTGGVGTVAQAARRARAIAGAASFFMRSLYRIAAQ